MALILDPFLRRNGGHGAAVYRVTAVSEGEPTMSTVIRLLLSLMLLAAPLGGGALAQQARKTAGHIGQNDTVIGLIAGPAGSQSMRMAGDMARVLDDERMRILPIAGKDPVQTVSDLLYLKGIDAIIVPSDVLAHVEKLGLHGDVANRIHYVTKLYSREAHLIVRRSVNGIGELEGRRVNLGPEQGASAITGGAVFAALGLGIEATRFEHWEALEKLKAGEIDAILHVAQKPVEILTALSPADGLKLLPLDLEGAAATHYPQALLTTADYPALIDPDGEVATVSVGDVLAVFNWPRGGSRQRRVDAFVQRLLDNFQALAEPPGLIKWRDVNLAAEVPGWQRDDEADKWLEAARKAAPAAAEQDEDSEALRTAFRRFLETTGEAEALSPEDQSELFQRFMDWKEAGGQ